VGFKNAAAAMLSRSRYDPAMHLVAYCLALSFSSSQVEAERLPMSPHVVAVESLDALVLKYMARECRAPAPEDTLFTELPYDAVLTIDTAIDAWGNPFVYNAPAILGSAQFDLYSVGPNGIDEGGAGDDDANWIVRRQISKRWANLDVLSVWSSAYSKGEPRFRAAESTSRPSSQEPTLSRPPRENSGADEQPHLILSVAKWTALVDLPVFLLVWLLLLWRRGSLFVTFVVVVVLSPTSGFARASEADSPPVAAIYRYTETQLSILKSGIEDFRASTCRYPGPMDTLARLQRAGLDSLATLARARDYWGNSFVVRAPSVLPNEVIDIYSIGLNGKDEAGMGDDIGFGGNQRSFDRHYAPGHFSEESSSRTSGGSPSDPGGFTQRSPENRHGASARIVSTGLWLGYVDVPLILAALLLRRRRSHG